MEDEEKKLVTRDHGMTSEHITPADLEVMAQRDEDTIVITPAILAEIQGTIDARRVAMQREYPKLVLAAGYKTRLAITTWVFENLMAHAREGGSFRYLVYERLGFREDAYLPLDLAGAITISNLLNDANKKGPR